MRNFPPQIVYSPQLAGQALLSRAGTLATVYLDAAGTQVATSLLLTDGTPLTAGRVTLTATSRTPGLRLDGGDEVPTSLFVKPDGGTLITEIYANSDELLARLTDEIEQFYLTATEDYVAVGTPLLALGSTELSNDPSVPGGVAIGGQGPGAQSTILGSSGNAAWVQTQPTRVGSAHQVQVYPGGYAGLASSVGGSNLINLTYGDLYGDLTDLHIDMPIGFNGRMYRLAAVPTSRTQLALKQMNGGAFTFPSSVSGTYKIAYTVSETTADVSGTSVTRVSGDEFHVGFYDTTQVRIGGIFYVVNGATKNSLNLTSSAGTATGVVIKQISVDAAFYFTLGRWQGIRGSTEDNGAVTLNLAGQLRFESHATSGVTHPTLVFGTGPDPSIPTSVTFNSRKAHLAITPTGEVIAGYEVADPFNVADLASALFTVTPDPPKLASYRYSSTAQTGGGTSRMTLGRFGMSYAGNIRTLDVASYNNFFGPYLQGRQGNGAPVDIATQVEGGNFVVGGPRLSNATSGWLWISSCAGTPTGAPSATFAGTVPLVYDSTNNKLHIFNGGSWKAVTFA